MRLFLQGGAAKELETEAGLDSAVGSRCDAKVFIRAMRVSSPDLEIPSGMDGSGTVPIGAWWDVEVRTGSSLRRSESCQRAYSVSNSSLETCEPTGAWVVLEVLGGSLGGIHDELELDSDAQTLLSSMGLFWIGLGTCFSSMGLFGIKLGTLLSSMD